MRWWAALRSGSECDIGSGALVSWKT